ncbi:MAG: CBS domain-containing protein, partial [Candidatus Caldarchaeum sp.]|nr:CBS domain-containing protein [Candidatus Caldarchaeum sp.]
MTKVACEIKDEDIKEVLREIKTYVDVTESDLMLVFQLALKYAKRRLEKAISVREVMTENVISAERDRDAHGVLTLLREKKITGIPVVDNKRRVV